jgi:hypothetical protein
MRKAIFCMHTGAVGSGVLLDVLKRSLDEHSWCFADDACASMHGTYDRHQATEPGVQQRFQKFSNSMHGLIETNDAFIKNFSQQAAIKFGKDMRLIHLVRDPMSVCSQLLDVGSYPDDGTNRHIPAGRHIRKQDHWTPFQKNLWEWADCQIASVLLTQQIGANSTIVLPMHRWSEALPSVMKWVQDDVSISIPIWPPEDEASPSAQDDVESYTWFNGLPEPEKRMVVMALKALLKVEALPAVPSFAVSAVSS